MEIRENKKEKKAVSGASSSSFFLLASPRRSFFFPLLLLFFLSPRFRSSTVVTPLPTDSERLMKFILIYSSIYSLAISVYLLPSFSVSLFTLIRFPSHPLQPHSPGISSSPDLYAPFPRSIHL